MKTHPEQVVQLWLYFSGLGSSAWLCVSDGPSLNLGRTGWEKHFGMGSGAEQCIGTYLVPCSDRLASWLEQEEAKLLAETGHLA